MWGRGGDVKLIVRYLVLGLISAAVPVEFVAAAPAAQADCNNAGYATVCAQGTVTGGSTTPVQTVYPGYCADPWYCNDNWGVDIDLNPPNRPGRPGGGGGPPIIRPGGGGRR
jgi:hypothetical protein